MSRFGRLRDAALADLTRLRRGRAGFVALAACPVLVALGTVATTGTPPHAPDPESWRSLSTAGVVVGPALALGAVSVTGEHRHGELAAAIAATGSRGLVLAGRTVAALVAGVGLGLLTAGCALGFLFLWRTALHRSTAHVLPQGWLLLARSVLVAALAAASGAAAAVLARGRPWVPAVLLAWAYGVDSMLASAAPTAERWMPGGAAIGLLGGGPSWALPPASAFPVLAGWCCLISCLAFLSLRRWELRA